MTSMMTLSAANILATSLNDAGMTPDQLARDAGLELSVVSGWLDGSTEIDLLSLARVLDVCETPKKKIGTAICTILNVSDRAA